MIRMHEPTYGVSRTVTGGRGPHSDDSQRPQQLWLACTHSAMNSILMSVCQQLPAMVLRLPRSAWPHGESGDDLIHWALEELGVEQIVVCGHSNCGPSRSSVRGFQDYRSYHDRLRNREQVNHAARVRLIEQLADLQRRSSVASAIRRGALTVTGLWYLTETGTFSAYNEQTRTWEPIWTPDMKQRG